MTEGTQTCPRKDAFRRMGAIPLLPLAISSEEHLFEEVATAAGFAVGSCPHPDEVATTAPLRSGRRARMTKRSLFGVAGLHPH